MGAAVKAEEASTSEALKVESELKATNKQLAADLAEASLDVVGIFDPTPTSDAISAGLAMSRGDYVSAGLSLISMVPGIGDAVAKPIKGTRLAARMSKLAKKIAALTAKLKKIKAAREEAAALVRAAREKAKRARIKDLVEDCPKLSPFGTRTPKTGKWSKGRGNSAWTPGPDTRGRDEILSVTKGKPIGFKDGYPDFSPYATHKVEITMTGNDAADFATANKAARLPETPEGFTWHHSEDGKTMQLVPSALNNNVPHSGGASIVSSKEY
jgi:hypothetical protein